MPIRIVALIFTVSLLAFLSHPAAAANQTLRLETVLEENMLYVWEGEELKKSYTVSVGKKGHPTPEGTFRIRRMIWNPRWVPPPDAAWARGKTAKGPEDPDNPMKKVKIFFKDPDYYIHGTGAIEKLGQADSHGCIRMDPEDAGELAQMIMKATGAPQDESWIRRILRMGRPRSITLPSSVEINIH